MDIASLIGIIVAGGGLVWAMYESTHGNMMAFYSSEGIVVVLLGSFAAGMMAMPMETVKNCFGILKKWLLFKEMPMGELVGQLVSYAEVARRDGMLALEDSIKQLEDPFLKKGLQLAIDGTDPEVIEETLRIEVEALAERHKNGKRFFEMVGAFGPGFGLTATLIGQIAMFQNLDGDIAAIGKSLSMALCATLYGAIICNAFCGPIANKLGVRSEEEQMLREMILVGIMSIQAGDNPNVVEMKLHSFLSDRQRRAMEKK